MIPNALKAKKQAGCKHERYVRVPMHPNHWECVYCGKEVFSTGYPATAYRKIARYELEPDEQKIVDEMMK